MYEQLLLDAPSSASYEGDYSDSGGITILSDILHTEVPAGHFSSFLFPFIADTNITSNGSNVFTVIGSILLYIVCLILLMFFNSKMLWQEVIDRGYGGVIDRLRSLFHPQSLADNPYKIFMEPPIYIQLVIFLFCCLAYVSLFRYNSRRFMTPFFHKIYLFLCEGLSPVLLLYSVETCVVYILTALATRQHNSAVYLSISGIAVFCFPALYIAVTLALCDIHLTTMPFASNYPKMAVAWLSILIVIATIECLMFCLAGGNDDIHAFMTMSISILGVVDSYLALSRFFLSLLSQICALSISLIAAVNGAIVFFNTLFHVYVDFVVWISVLAAFDVAIIIGSIIYVLVRNAKVQRTIMAGSFDCSHFHNSEVMLFFSQTRNRYTKRLENPQMIKKMFHGHDVSYKLQILMVRFLIAKQMEIEFVYRKSLQLMAVCSSSFIDSLQCYTIGTMAAELLGSKKFGKKMHRQQFLEIFWDSLCAETQFWTDVLASYSGNISRSAAKLFSRVKNAENYFSQIGTDTILSSKYAMQYIDFVTNVSCNYAKLSEIGLEMLEDESNELTDDDNEPCDHRYWLSDIQAKWPDDVVLSGRMVRVTGRVCEDYPVLKPLVRLGSLVSDETLERAQDAETYLECDYHTAITVMYTVCLLSLVLCVSFVTWILRGYFAIRPKPLYFRDTMSDITKICMAIISTMASHVQLLAKVYPIEYAQPSDALKFISAARTVDLTSESLLGTFINKTFLNDFLDVMEVWTRTNYTTAEGFLSDPGRVSITEDIAEMANRLLLTCQMNGVILASDTIELEKNCAVGYVYVGLTFVILLLIVIGAVFFTSRRLSFFFKQCLNIPKEEVAQIYMHYRKMTSKYARSDVVNELSKSVFERRGLSYQQTRVVELLVPVLLMFFILMIFMYILSLISNESGVLTLMALTSTVSFPYCVNQMNYVLYVVGDFEDADRYIYPLLFTSRILLKMVSENNETDLMNFDFNSLPMGNETLVYVPGASDIDWEQHTGYTPEAKVGYWQSVQVCINTGLQAIVLFNNSRANSETITPASMMVLNQYVLPYMDNITDTFYWVCIENSVKFYALLITYIVVCSASFILLLASIMGFDSFHKFLLRKLAVVPNVYPIARSIYPPVVAFDVVSEIPCGLIVTDGAVVTWANDCALKFYGGLFDIGDHVPDDWQLENYVDAEGQTHAFTLKRELLAASPIRSVKEIKGEWLYIIRESTGRRVMKQKIRDLVQELSTLRQYMIGNVQVRFMPKDSSCLFIKSFAMVEIGVPESLLGPEVFDKLRVKIWQIAQESTSLLKAEVLESSICFVFCTTNIKSYERQYIRDTLIFSQRIYSQIMCKKKYHGLRLAICGGKNCYCKVTNAEKFYVSLYSPSLLKSAMVLRQAQSGEVVMELQFLKQVTEVEFDSLDINTFQYCGRFIDYTVLPNGIKFSDGVCVM